MPSPNTGRWVAIAARAWHMRMREGSQDRWSCPSRNSTTDWLRWGRLFSNLTREVRAVCEKRRMVITGCGKWLCDDRKQSDQNGIRCRINVVIISFQNNFALLLIALTFAPVSHNNIDSLWVILCLSRQCLTASTPCMRLNFTTLVMAKIYIVGMTLYLFYFCPVVIMSSYFQSCLSTWTAVLTAEHQKGLHS